MGGLTGDHTPRVWRPHAGRTWRYHHVPAAQPLGLSRYRYGRQRRLGPPTRLGGCHEPCASTCTPDITTHTDVHLARTPSVHRPSPAVDRAPMSHVARSSECRRRERRNRGIGSTAERGLGHGGGHPSLLDALSPTGGLRADDDAERRNDTTFVAAA